MPASGFGFFAYLCYAGISGPGGIVGAVLFSLAGLFFWYQIYITASRRGIAEFVSRLDASPDLDNLAPTGNSNYRKLTAREYFDLHQKGELLFNLSSHRSRPTRRSQYVAIAIFIRQSACFSYKLQDSRISTYTNSSWESHDMDILLGEPAVVMSQVEE
ncbi:MAG: hypothetical protein HUU34_00470 [Saprospiraceae bacterium]|jgi:hypothetical protein|nr:hypothetical protein [Saprospiraceae bacterium]